MEQFYITKGVKEHLHFRVIELLYRLFEELLQSDLKLDYLLIFESFRVNNTQLIRFKQEVPERSYEYVASEEVDDFKIYIIESQTEQMNSYWTMLLPEEY